MVKPTMRVKVGACIASVFLNEVAGADQPMPRISLQRVYKDKSGEFRYTSNLMPRDLPNARMALQRVWEKLSVEEQGAEDR